MLFSGECYSSVNRVFYSRISRKGRGGGGFAKATLEYVFGYSVKRERDSGSSRKLRSHSRGKAGLCDIITLVSSEGVPIKTSWLGFKVFSPVDIVIQTESSERYKKL